MQKPYYLVVNAIPNKQGGTGKKYTNIDEASDAAARYLQLEPSKYPEGVHICAPIRHVKLSAPPVTITAID
jgi:hypothetical protein